jgi:Zn-dependent membrane protease YugP
MKEHDLDGVSVMFTPDELIDNYNPNQKTIWLSSSTYKTDRVTSLSIIFHELGHAIQHREGNKWFMLVWQLQRLPLVYYLFFPFVVFVEIDANRKAKRELRNILSANDYIGSCKILDSMTQAYIFKCAVVFLLFYCVYYAFTMV